MGPKLKKMSHMTLTPTIWLWFVVRATTIWPIDALASAISEIRKKTQNNEWLDSGWLGSHKVISNAPFDRDIANNFLFTSHSTFVYLVPFSTFRYIASNLAEVVTFRYLTSILNLTRIFSVRKLKGPRLSRIVVLRWHVKPFNRTLACNKQTDRHNVIQRHSRARIMAYTALT